MVEIQLDGLAAVSAAGWEHAAVSLFEPASHHHLASHLLVWASKSCKTHTSNLRRYTRYTLSLRAQARTLPARCKHRIFPSSHCRAHPCDFRMTVWLCGIGHSQRCRISSVIPENNRGSPRQARWVTRAAGRPHRAREEYLGIVKVTQVKIMGQRLQPAARASEGLYGLCEEWKAHLRHARIRLTRTPSGPSAFRFQPVKSSLAASWVSDSSLMLPQSAPATCEQLVPMMRARSCEGENAYHLFGST